MIIIKKSKPGNVEVARIYDNFRYFGSIIGQKEGIIEIDASTGTKEYIEMVLKDIFVYFNKNKHEIINLFPKANTINFSRIILFSCGDKKIFEYEKRLRSIKK